MGCTQCLQKLAISFGSENYIAAQLRPKAVLHYTRIIISPISTQVFTIFRRKNSFHLFFEAIYTLAKIHVVFFFLPILIGLR